MLADRFYPSVELFEWLHARGWQYRLRLTGNLNVDPGFGAIVTTGALAAGQTERYLPNVRLFNHGVPTHLGIPHEAGHPEPWIIAMNCTPNRATVRDYASRWGIERLFNKGSYMVAPVCYKPPIDDGETRKIAAIHSDFS